MKTLTKVILVTLTAFALTLLAVFYCTAQNVTVTTVAGLQKALTDAATKPIGVIYLNAPVFNVKGLLLPDKLATGSRRLTIDGNNYTINVDSIGFYRNTKDQAQAFQQAQTSFEFKNIHFKGNGIGIHLTSSLGSKVNYCKFNGLKQPLVMKFCLLTKIYDNVFTNFDSIAVTSVAGNSWGAAIPPSSDNCNIYSGNRFYQKQGSFSSYYIEGGTNNVSVKDSFFVETHEGGNPNDKFTGSKYSIYFNSKACTCVGSFAIYQMYAEVHNSVALIYGRPYTGSIVIDGLRNVYQNTIFQIEALNQMTVSIKHVDFLRADDKFQEIRRPDGVSRITVVASEFKDKGELLKKSRWVGGLNPKVEVK